MKRKTIDRTVDRPREQILTKQGMHFAKIEEENLRLRECAELYRRQLELDRARFKSLGYTARGIHDALTEGADLERPLV